MHTAVTHQRGVAFVLVVWLITALVVCASGVLVRVPVPPPAIGITLTIAIIATLRLSRTARLQVHALGAARLVSIHIVRIIAGAYFLLLHSRGLLPGEFAIAAGWGDIVVGIGAILVLWLCVPIRTATQRTAVLAWNAIGLVDILLVFARGGAMVIADPVIGDQFRQLPLGLLPTFVVPLVIASHLLLFTWHRTLDTSGDTSPRT